MSDLKKLVKPFERNIICVEIFDTLGNLLDSWNCDVDEEILKTLSKVDALVFRFFQARGDAKPGFILIYEKAIVVVKRVFNGIIFLSVDSQTDLVGIIRTIEDMELKFVRFIDLKSGGELYGNYVQPLFSPQNLIMLKEEFISFLRHNFGESILARVRDLITDMDVKDDITYWNMLIEHISSLVEREFGPVLAKGVKTELHRKLSYYLALEESS